MSEFRSALRHQWQRLRGTRWLFVLWCLLTAVAVVRTVLLSIFMVDPGQARFSSLPHIDEIVVHSCLTAYAFGSVLAADPPEDLYAVEHYQAETTEVALDVAPFEPEPYQYPPQFLLPIDALRALTGDFLDLRTAWYLVVLLVSAASLYWVSRWIGGELGARLLLWSPVLWATPFFVTTLQLGNVHFVLIAMSLLAMIAFERGRYAAGGLMLAYAISSKIFPGIFGLYLLVQRRFKAAAWTAGFGVLLALGSWLVHGAEPMRQFLTLQLPRLADGSAFEFFRREEWYPLASLAFRSLAVKMEAVGWIDDYDAVVGPLGLAYSLVIVPVCILLALVAARPLESSAQRMGRFLTWSTVLTLASLQGAFTPMPYAPLGPIWLMVAIGVSLQDRRYIALLVPVWVLIALPVPEFGFSLAAHFALYLFLAAVAAWRLRAEARSRRGAVPASIGDQP